MDRWYVNSLEASTRFTTCHNGVTDSRLTPLWQIMSNVSHARRSMETTYTTIELGTLVHQYQLGLVLIAGVRADTEERPVQWVQAV